MTRFDSKVDITPGQIIRWVIRGVVCVFVGGILLGTCYTVPAGSRAIILTFGKPDLSAKSEGLHVKIPFVQSRIILDVQTQKYSARADAASTDLQVVSTEVTINYRLDPEAAPTVYRDLGVDYSDKIIQPVNQEVVKACVAKHKAEELITQREMVKQEIDSMLRLRLAERHIQVEAVSITHFDFSPTFNAAIEAKVTAEQNALAAKNKLEQVKYEAEQSIAKAKGEAEAIRIQAEAIMSQGGKDYVSLKAVEKWDGKLPIYTGGAMPFVDVTKK